VSETPPGPVDSVSTDPNVAPAAPVVDEHGAVISETVTTTTTDTIEYALPATPNATVEGLDVTRYPQGQMVGEHQMRLPSAGVYLDDLNAEGKATVVPDASGIVTTPGGLTHTDVTSAAFDGGDPFDPNVYTNDPAAVNATPDGFNAVDAPAPSTVSGAESQISSEGYVAPSSDVPVDTGTAFPGVTTPAETFASSAPQTPDVVTSSGDTVASGDTSPTVVEPAPATVDDPNAIPPGQHDYANLISSGDTTTGGITISPPNTVDPSLVPGSDVPVADNSSPASTTDSGTNDPSVQ
jgi:hypothetical protein